jgi:beta-glucanase (GH16 family)
MKLSGLTKLILITAFMTAGCTVEQKSKTVSVLVEAESFTAASGEATATEGVEGQSVVSGIEAGGWLAYDVTIPEAGRYKCEIKLSSGSNDEGICWVEDYVENTDGRTYNITANMAVPATRKGGVYSVISKEGSPLDAGTHKMKLHVDTPDVSVDWIKFTLMKRHQVTPKSLTQNVEGSEWKLVWSDEFDGSGLPDSTKWTYDFGNWGWGNNEPQYYTAYRSENARQENGNLIIEARRDDMGQPWTSARLTTRGKVSFLYGKIEFRAKVPAGDGTWAAGWLLGDEYRDEISWPYCGEVDILECVGREIDDESGDGINHASCHTRGYYFKQGNHITNVIPVKDMVGEYHTYGIEWSPKEIVAYLDGEKYYTYDKQENEWAWPFNKAQNIIINLAMGGGMGGAIDPDLTSQQFIVDYVRVFELQ